MRSIYDNAINRLKKVNITVCTTFVILDIQPIFIFFCLLFAKVYLQNIFWLFKRIEQIWTQPQNSQLAFQWKSTWDSNRIRNQKTIFHLLNGLQMIMKVTDWLSIHYSHCDLIIHLERLLFFVTFWPQGPGRWQRQTNQRFIFCSYDIFERIHLSLIDLTLHFSQRCNKFM